MNAVWKRKTSFFFLFNNRHCLNMVESDSEEVAAELDLISSLEILPELGIQKLPLQGLCPQIDTFGAFESLKKKYL